MAEKLKLVTKEVFDEFVNSYEKGVLVGDVTGICEPPLLTLNDFRNGRVWPDSVVASIVLDEGLPGEHVEDQRFFEYRILNN